MHHGHWWLIRYRESVWFIDCLADSKAIPCRTLSIIRIQVVRIYSINRNGSVPGRPPPASRPSISRLQSAAIGRRHLPHHSIHSPHEATISWWRQNMLMRPRSESYRVHRMSESWGLVIQWLQRHLPHGDLARSTPTVVRLCRNRAPWSISWQYYFRNVPDASPPWSASTVRVWPMQFRRIWHSVLC